MKSILKYLKDSKFPETNEELRRKKNTFLESNDDNKEKIKARNELDNAKRQLRPFVQKDKRFKLVARKFKVKSIKRFQKIVIIMKQRINKKKNKDTIIKTQGESSNQQMKQIPISFASC